ncbi:MAG: hypothetical protein SGBAC_003725 [Bacillariaceae sp.]
MSKLKRFGREYITCDGPNCNVSAPEKRCSRCKTVFYCSVSCQKKHWNVDHKNSCRDTSELKVNAFRDGDETIPQAGGELKEQSNQDCAICLGALVDPYVLPSCGHAFCFTCLAEWQRKIKRGAIESILASARLPQKNKNAILSCPACRAETPDVVDAIVKRAKRLAARAYNPKTSESDKINLRKEVLADLDKLENFHPGCRRPIEEVVSLVDVEANFQRLFSRAEILISIQEPEKAKEDLFWLQDLCELAVKNRKKFLSMLKQLKALVAQGKKEEYEELKNKIDEFAATHNKVTMVGIRFDIYATLGEVEENAGNWEAAKELYIAMIENLKDHPDIAITPQHRTMLLGLSRCEYHLQNYDQALAVGEVAVEIQRSYPFCHKYIALSYKAMGHMEGAKVTMARALVYEAPWDDQHREEVLQLYREIIGEEPEAQQAAD